MTIRRTDTDDATPTTESSGRGGARPGAGRRRKIRGDKAQLNVELNKGQLAKLDRIIRQVERVTTRQDAIRWLLEEA